MISAPGNGGQPGNRTIFIHDNLPVLEGMNSGMADLIYLDPPFNKNRIFGSPLGEPENGRFEDIWNWSTVKDEHLTHLEIRHPKIAAAIRGAARMGGEPYAAYLTFMGIRLAQMWRVLKESGSIYLHCDHTAGHYLKVMMDAVFGRKNFRNEIVWFYPDTPGRPKRDFPRKHDTIFRYAKKGGWLFNADNVRVPIAPESRERYKYSRTLGGREYLGGKSAVAGKVPEDVWRFPAVKKNSKESCGYPTQKPLALMERIIKASSREGDLVLDPFCGCATTCVAAERLKRKWIGIDLHKRVADLIGERLRNENIGLHKKVCVRDKPPKLTEAVDPRFAGSLFGWGLAREDLGDSGLPAKQKEELKVRLYSEQRGKCGNNHCPYGEVGYDFMELDHIKPRAKGGEDSPGNIQLLCGPCNRRKGDRNWDEFLKEEARREKIAPLIF